MNPKNRNKMTDKDWEALRHSLSLPSQKEGWNQLLPALEQQLPLKPAHDKKRRRRYLWLWWMIAPTIAILLYFITAPSRNNLALDTEPISTGVQNADSESDNTRNTHPGSIDVNSTDKAHTTSKNNNVTGDSLNLPAFEKQSLDTDHFKKTDKNSTTASGKKANELVSAKEKKTGSVYKNQLNRPLPGNNLPAKRSRLSTGNLQQSGRATRNKYSNKVARSSNRPEPENTIQTERPPVNNETGHVNNQPEQAAVGQPKDSSTTSVQKTGSTRVDSFATEAPVTSIENKELLISAGLQWTFQVPASNPSPYFTGPDLSFQPYRNLVPGAWIRVQVERSAIIADVTPFYSTIVSARPHYTFYQSTRVGDTIINTTEVRSMRKNFGLGAGIGYEYQLFPRWWIGVGFHSYWWNKAIGQAEGLEEKIPVGGTDKLSRNYNRDYIIPSEENSYFRKSQQNLSFTALYTKNKWQAGLRGGITFSSLAKRDGPRNLTRFDFLFRLPLIGAKKKSGTPGK